ncbi:penicillin acylase family protein [Candidatus Aminicenantes bacterium AH-873-B07]|jgi:penicillin amidase|nr:penicillin acylase family protein [Candidatus Aminicenantes bacterium AH-873-B07]
MKKSLKIILFTVLSLIIGIIFILIYLFHSSLPQIKGEISIKGISNRIEIIRDKFGIPHIFAKNEKDLFFACGYVHAQDRLWQMELMRRSGYGTLSEIFGEKTLKRDIRARILGLKIAAQKELNNLNPKIKKIFLYYCKGVNAYIKKKKNLAPEFTIIGFKPKNWTILDSLIIKQTMALILSSNMNSEFLRMELNKKFRIKKLEEILSFSSNERKIISFSNIGFDFSFFQNKIPGSNSWVVDGTLTKTGKPLLANDPHLTITHPPIWYELHLNCPGINVIGVSIPGTPGIIIGHNDNIAWGMTYSYVDVQDLYLEKLDKKGQRYLYNKKWRNLKIYEEKIKIKGKKKPKIIKIKWTHRGPIISPWIYKSDIPISLKWTIYEGGRTPEAIYLINKAKNWKEFIKGASLFDSPSLNLTYADRNGNIGYYLTGKIPLRKNHNGLFPVSGDTDKFEWIGYLKENEKPFSYNPPQHFIITANNKMVSDDYPYFLGNDYLASFRAKRIKELLLKEEKHTIKSFQKIQLDIISNKARLLLPFIKELKKLSKEAKKAQEILKNWNGAMEEGKEAALFQVFLRFLIENTFKDELEIVFSRFREVTFERQAGILQIVNSPNSSWFDNVKTPEIETRNDIIELSLAQAYSWLKEKFGPPENWNWADMHAINFQHSLGQIPIFKFLNRGPFSLKGSGDTINSSHYSHKNPYYTTAGVSYRQIIDLGNFKNSIWVLTSGQSGHFLSRHYDNQINLWIKGKYYHMLFYKKDIEKETEAKLILKPIN